MNILRLTLCLMLSTLSLQVFAWGQNGHRIIGQIADTHLTETTRLAIQPLLAGDRLPEVATWADEMRSAPGEFWQKDSPSWHYVNFDNPHDFKPDHYHTPTSKAEVADIYGAILRSIVILKSSDANLDERQFYFRFLVHLVGDIHQPLHAGHAEDKGGNTLDVFFFGNKTNLHSLWDTGLIESKNLSFSEFADFINTHEPPRLQEYLMSGPADWLRESMAMSKDVYASNQGSLSYAYVYQQLPLVEQRLLQGGVRLAGLLNSIFDPQAKVGSQALPVNAVAVKK